LNCSYNSLTSLDLSSNTTLIYLNCDYNSLTSLDVSNDSSLRTLTFDHNSLTSLDLSSNTALTHLYCGSNSLISLDVSSNTALTHLYCSSNSLTSMDVSSNTALTTLYCGFNSLTSLNLSTNTALIYLFCHKNSLTSLDLSSNTDITVLYCSFNSLTTLNVKNGNNINFSNFYANNNPGLSCIQVDDSVWSTTNWLNKDAGATYSENCHYCFVNIPDANFKNALLAISGLDANNDGEIQCSEAADYTGNIDVNGLGIYDLTGIEAFSQILALNCMNNHLTTLDLSGCTSLDDLMCMNNQLISLNLTVCPNIYNLMCMNNQLLSLNVDGCTSLNFLDCSDNQLTTLDVSSCTNLSSLLCVNNQLTKLYANNGNNLFWFSSIDNSSLFCIQVYDAVYANNNLINEKDSWATYSEDCNYCTNPTNGGEIEANYNAVCIGDTGVEFSNTIFPSGESGVLEYQWQVSLDGVNFSDLTVGTYTSTAYISGVLTDTTYFRRLSRVSCMTDWTGAAISNVIMINVNPLPNIPVIGFITQANCINATGSVELSDLPIGNWTVNPGANPGSSLSATIYNLPNGVNNLTVTDENGCTSLPTADITIDAQPELPTMQATSLNVSSISAHSMTISWTRGSGDGVVVVARYGSEINTDPQGGTIYNANASFGMGDPIGNGNFVVYNGTDTSVNVTGLSAQTSYYFAVYEYKSSTNCYLVPALTGSATTTYYCTAGAIDNTNDYITNLTIGSINHSSGNGSNGYEDFTSESTPLGIGDSISATISFINSDTSSQLLIWVDWNHDGDFDDANENVYVSNSSITSSHTTASFSAPVGAVLGATRMRVRLNNSATGPNITPCGYSDLGEVEDYTLILYNTNVDAGSDLTVCLHDSVQLQAIGGLIYNWTPTEGLSNPNIANPYASPQVTTKYYLNANAQGPNLIVNGDFSSGNTGFTSDYTYSNSNNTESYYTVTPSPYWWHNLFSECGDHTTGNGNMMVMNGSFSNNTVIWSETITVKPHTNYAFSSWVTSVHPSDPAILQFSVNNNLLGTSFNASSTTCNWERFYQVWNSGNDTTAEIKIVNQNIVYFGNDFALDDIYFSEMEAISDSVIVTVLDLPSAPIIESISQPTCLQANGSVSLSGLPSIGGWIVNPWSISGSGNTLLTTNLSAGTYSITVTNANGCTSIPATDVVIDPQPIQTSPVITILSQPSCSQTTGDIALNGLPDTWVLSQDPGSTIIGSGTTTTISNLTTGVYNFTITNSDGCVSIPTEVTIEMQPVQLPPVVGTVTQPSCTEPTASIELIELPSGNWVINPGAITGSTTSTVIVGLTEGIYNFTITNEDGCTSSASADITINTAPIQSPPVIGTIIQPSCLLSTGSVELTDLPDGNWTINPGSITGSTSSITFSNLAAGTYTYTVTNADGCTSLASSDAIVDVQPIQPPPVVGTIVQPSCYVATGSVELTNLPDGDWTINPGSITGFSSSITISNLAAGTYTYTVTNADGCTSIQSEDIDIQTQPLIPDAPSGASSQSFCNSANVSNLIASGNIIKWYDAVNSVTVLDSSTALIDGNHYFASQTVNGCESTNWLDVNVTINPNPSVNIGSVLTTICQSATTVALGGSFGGSATAAIWDDGGAGGTFFGNDGSSPFTATYTTLPTASSTVLLTLTTSGGNCGDTSASKILSINLVSVGGTITGLNSITYGSSTGTLTLDGYTGNIQKWQKKLGAGSWIDINNTISTYSEIPDSAGTWNYRAEIKSGVCSMTYSSEFSVTVNKKALSITADNKTKNFDGFVFSNPYTVTYSGFVTGENSSVLNGSLSFSGTAITATAIGNNYTIIPGGFTSGNYFITYYNGTLTITNSSCNAVVLNNQNSGAGSLREAIATVCDNGTITFVNNMNGQIINLTTGTLIINKNIILNDSNLMNGFAINGLGDNITIISGKKLTIANNSKITVTGAIKNNSGISGLQIASGASFIHNTVDLPATVQRNLTNVWHLFGSPFKKNTGAMLANITGTTQMMPYTNGTGWGTTTTSPVTLFVPTVGYAIKPSATITASFSGKLYYSAIPADYTTSLIYNGTSANQSWNLVANPYTASIDFNLLGKTNLSSTLYYWDNAYKPNVTPIASASYMRTYNSCNGVGVPAGTLSYIAPLQGFFVKAVYTSPKLAYTPSARVHKPITYYKDASNTEIIVRLKTETEEGSDELVICKNDNSKLDFEQFDSEKLFNDSPVEIYSQSTSGENLVINTINVTANNIIPLGIRGNAGKKVKITAFALETAEQIYLEDRFKGKLISLTEHTAYEFELPTENLIGRFFIRFNNTNAALTTSDVKVFESDNELNIIAQTGEELKTVEVYSLTGACVFKAEGNGNVFTTKLQLAPATYMVRVKTSIATQNVKVSWK